MSNPSDEIDPPSVTKTDELVLLRITKFIETNDGDVVLPGSLAIVDCYGNLRDVKAWIARTRSSGLMI